MSVTKACDRCGNITNLKNIHIVKEVYNDGICFAWICDECYDEEREE